MSQNTPSDDTMEPSVPERHADNIEALPPNSPESVVDAGEMDCLMGEFVSGSRTSGLYFQYMGSLGNAIDYARDDVLPQEWRLSTDEVDEATRRLDALRERYEAEGYQEGMADELERISDDYFTERELGPIYVLPWDLDDALETFGNPLMDEDEDEDDEEGRARTGVRPRQPRAPSGAVQPRRCVQRAVAPVCSWPPPITIAISR